MATSVPPVVGQPPTAEDEFWTEAAKQLTPEKSLERIDGHGKYLFGIVAGTTVLFTGLGTLGPAAVDLRANRLLLVPVALICLSLGLAMAGITPRLDKVNRSNLVDVRRYYNALVRRRGRFVFWAGMSFALALLAIPLALARLPGPSPQPVKESLLLKAVRAAAGSVASLRVEYRGLPPEASIETRLTGERKQAAPVVLYAEVSRSNQSDSLVIEAQSDVIDGYCELVLESTARTGTRVLASDRAVLMR